MWTRCLGHHNVNAWCTYILILTTTLNQVVCVMLWPFYFWELNPSNTNLLPMIYWVNSPSCVYVSVYISKLISTAPTVMILTAGFPLLTIEIQLLTGNFNRGTAWDQNEFQNISFATVHTSVNIHFQLWWCGGTKVFLFIWNAELLNTCLFIWMANWLCSLPNTKMNFKIWHIHQWAYHAHYFPQPVTQFIILSKNLKSCDISLFTGCGLHDKIF
jgi:hypothetical protein